MQKESRASDEPHGVWRDGAATAVLNVSHQAVRPRQNSVFCYQVSIHIAHQDLLEHFGATILVKVLQEGNTYLLIFYVFYNDCDVAFLPVD